MKDSTRSASGTATGSEGQGSSLLTVGYEGVSAEDLLAQLVAAGVATLIDVRAVPWSRKPGFGRRALAEASAGAGITYVHLGALGTPEAGRRAARAGRRAEFERIFAARLDSAEAGAALDRVAEFLRGGPVCLLCYEADPGRCHRSIVAARLARRLGLSVRHLRPPASAHPTLPGLG